VTNLNTPAKLRSGEEGAHTLLVHKKDSCRPRKAKVGDPEEGLSKMETKMQKKSAGWKKSQGQS